MKIRFANNIDKIDADMEVGTSEMNIHEIKRMSQLTQDGIIIATEIFNEYPGIRQVILDTMTDEERDMIKHSLSKSGGKA